jgi:hypothetical protein
MPGSKAIADGHPKLQEAPGPFATSLFIVIL